MRQRLAALARPLESTQMSVSRVEVAAMAEEGAATASQDAEGARRGACVGKRTTTTLTLPQSQY
jgi:hypothetical protein